MEQRVLDEDEEELYGIRRKKILVKGNEEETPEEDEGAGAENLTAELDDEYVYEGYPQEEGVPEYAFPQADEDDESLVMLSPEEAERLVREREEKEKREEEEARRCIEEGNAALGKGDFAQARTLFDRANELRPDDLDVNVGYMRAHAEDFSSLDDFDGVDKAYGLCYDSAGEAFAGKIKELFGDRLSALKEEISREKEEKERVYRAEQENRRAALKARADKVSGNFMKVFMPLLVVALFAVVCASLVNVVEGNVLLILAVVAGVLSVALLIPTLFIGRKLIDLRRLQRENERDDSTEAGREIVALQEKIDFIDDCLE